MQDATMPETDSREALQVFGPSRWWSAAARQRFIAAMQPVLGLRHPNLVSTLAISERGDTVVILAEDVAGVTLESILAAEPVQSIGAIASILTQVAMAVELAHTAGVVHGAISASCVVVDERGDAKLADMGVAAAMAAAGVHDIGDSASPAYAGPELLRGERPSPAADQYALGALAFELLAGRGPLEVSESWLRRAQLRWHPDSMDLSSYDVPEEWSRAVKRMLDKQPANRFASVTEAVRVFARANDAQDQRFRGPLGWIVKQQLSGAMPLEDDEEPDAAGEGRSPFASIDAPIVSVMEQRLRDAVLRHAPRISARVAGVRKRTLVVAACAVLAGAVAWFAAPPSARDRFQSNIELELSQLGNARSATSAMTSAPAPSLATDPTVPARIPAESSSVADQPPVVTSPPRPVQPPVAARAPVARPNAAARVSHAGARPRKAEPRPRQVDSRPRQRVEIATKAPPVEAQAPVPVVVTSMGAPPGAPSPSVSVPLPSAQPALPANASSAPVSAATASPMSPEAVASAPQPPSPRQLSVSEAGDAARTVISLLSSASVHSLSASMVPSQADEAFVDWLARRPIGLDVGTPTAPRVVQTADGGAQVRYVVPITWTHASGARPTRTATVLVSVRPTADGTRLVTWSLAQPFVP